MERLKFAESRNVVQTRPWRVHLSVKAVISEASTEKSFMQIRRKNPKGFKSIRGVSRVTQGIISMSVIEIPRGRDPGSSYRIFVSDLRYRIFGIGSSVSDLRFRIFGFGSSVSDLRRFYIFIFLVIALVIGLLFCYQNAFRFAFFMFVAYST